MIFTARCLLPTTPFSPSQWHAHEMFFGFGWAVLGGFLLTSTKNWLHPRLSRRGTDGAVVAAWLLERLGMWFAGDLPRPLFLLTNNSFSSPSLAMPAR